MTEGEKWRPDPERYTGTCTCDYDDAPGWIGECEASCEPCWENYLDVLDQMDGEE